LVKGIHDAEQNLALAQQFLNQPITLPKALSLTIPCEYARKDLLNKQDYFSCHPGSSSQRSMLEKRLPSDKFAELISRIYHRFGLKGALVGGAEEHNLRQKIRDKIPDALIDLSSESLNETAAIINHSVFFMGNDSGLMHMAVALGKNCVAFFGPSDESRTGPYFLARDSNRDRQSFSRGHLVITGRETGNGNQAESNPKLRFRRNRSLDSLKVEAAWKMMESFIKKILN
jgi:ADP-heptose:LPS heptosyltransferase